MELKENMIVLCTVKKIEDTAVFVNIDEINKEGSIVFSEIAAGRIRNIREYVVPNKKIVCKILKIYPDHIELSLRRVTGGEREETMDYYKKEKMFHDLIKNIIKDSEKSIQKIKEEKGLVETIEESKTNPKILEKYFKKDEAEKIIEAIAEKKEKPKEIKREIVLKSVSNTGLSDIKSVLDTDEAEIIYLGGSRFSITIKSEDVKKAAHTMQSILETIEKKAKEKKAVLEIKEK